MKRIFLPTLVAFAALLRVWMAPLPNIEPILVFTLTCSLAFGPITGFLFAFLSMLFSDILMGSVGIWTLYTSGSYGLVGFLAGLFFMKRKDPSRREMTLLSIGLIILYDLITAVCFALTFFIPIEVALINQIPFTILHLSNCIVVFLFYPGIVKLSSFMKNATLHNNRIICYSPNQNFKKLREF